jgi:hypothetical protein
VLPSLSNSASTLVEFSLKAQSPHHARLHLDSIYMPFIDPVGESCETERVALREIEREEWLIEEERRRLDERVREMKLRKKAYKKIIAAGENKGKETAGPKRDVSFVGRVEIDNTFCRRTHAHSAIVRQ